MNKDSNNADNSRHQFNLSKRCHLRKDHVPVETKDICRQIEISKNLDHLNGSALKVKTIKAELVFALL